MGRHVEHAGVVVEDVLGAVAVVDVPVDDGHALAAGGDPRPPPTAALLKRQNPIARSRTAWWPGGRASGEGDVGLPGRGSASTAASTAPAALPAAA